MLPQKQGDPNKPQVRIVSKDKDTSLMKSLVDKNQKNLRAFTYKVGEVGQKVSGYKEFFTNWLPALQFKDISLVNPNIGYNVPGVNINLKKPCIVKHPKTSPRDDKSWHSIDKSGRMKLNPIYNEPIQVRYTWLYQCRDGKQQESNSSPVVTIPKSVNVSRNLWGPRVEVFGDPSIKELKAVRVYVKAANDKDFKLRNQLSNIGSQKVVVMPRVN